MFLIVFSLGCSSSKEDTPIAAGPSAANVLALTLVSPPNNSYVNESNKLAYTLDGTCNGNQAVVSISSSIFSTPELANCVSEVWSKTIDFSSYADGAINLAIQSKDASDISSAELAVTLYKDVIAPPAPSFTLNNNETYTTVTNVNLQLIGFGITRMSISESSCNSSPPIPFSIVAMKTLTMLNQSTSIYVAYLDPAGNPSVCTQKSIIHDNTAPVITYTSHVDGASIPSNQLSSVTVSGTCSEDGVNLVFSGSVTGSAICSAGLWTNNFNMSALPIGPITIGATQTDLAGNVAVPYNLNLNIVDSLDLALIEPLAASFINQANQTSVRIRGTCGANGQDVVLSGDLIANIPCSAGVFDQNVNFTAVSDGNLSLVFNHTSAGGTQAAPITLSLIKDVVPPANPSFTIENNASYTRVVNVSLQLVGVDIATMSISEGSCNSSSPISFSTTASKTLTALNQNVSLYVAYFDSAGNASNCVQKSIIHDDLAPIVSFISPNAGHQIQASETSSFSVTGACSEESQNIIFSGDVTGSKVCTAGVWSHNFDLSALPDGVVTIGVAQTDLAGNSSIPVTRQFNKLAALSLTLIEPTGGSFINSSNASSVRVRGTCGADGRNVVLSGAVSTNIICSAGVFDQNIDFSSVSDANITVNLNHSSAVGAVAPEIVLALVKDTLPPSLPLVNINSSAVYTNLSSVNLSLSATDSVEMFVSNSVLCDIGSWEAVNASKSWTLSGLNSVQSVFVKFKDLAGNESACVSDTIIHDSIAPTIAWGAPAALSIVNSVNELAFAISGTCSENSQNVNISGAASKTALCTSGSWSTTINLSALGQGNLTLNLAQTDLAGNQTSGVSRIFTKDTQGPTLSSISINGGAAYTSLVSVNLSLSSTDASQMYITSQSDCLSGGVWEAFNSAKTYTLLDENLLNSVYVQYRDSSLNTSACISADIIHDSQPPEWSSVPTHTLTHGSLTQSPVVTYLEDAVDSGSGVLKYSYALGTGTSGVAASDILDWVDVSGGSFSAAGLTLIDATTYFVNMKVSDNLNQVTYISSVGWTVDTSAPALTITYPTLGLTTTRAEIDFSGTCEVGYPVGLSFGSDVVGDASTTCVGGLFKTYVRFTGESGSRTLTATQVDSGSNTATSSVSINYSKAEQFSGPVSAILKLNDGSTIVGGAFNSYSSSRQNYLVKTDMSGNTATFNLGDAFNGTVNSVLELADGSVLVGGSFTKYRGRTANRIAKINSDGSINTTFNPEFGTNGFDSTVVNFTVVGTDIFVVGSFTTYRGVSANRIAKLNLDGVLDSTFNSGVNGFNTTARFVINTSAGLFVGGDFTSYKGVVANYVAKINTNGDLDTTFNPASGGNGTGARVRWIAADNNFIYLLGDFTTYRGGVANRVAKVSLTTFGLDLTFNPASGSNGLAGAAYSGEMVGNNFYIGGSFSTYRGTTVNNIVKVAADTGVKDPTFNTGGTLGVNSTVSVIYVNGSYVYLGGAFSMARGQLAHRVAKLAISDASLDLVFSPQNGLIGADNTVNSIAYSTTGLWIGGAFATYRSGYAVQNIAKFNSNGSFNTNFSIQAAGAFNGIVRSLVATSDSSTVYVGGDFVSYQGLIVNRIAKLDASTGALDTTFSPQSGNNGFNTGGVYALALYNDTDLFAGGSFGTYRTGLTNKIAKINSLGVLDTAYNPTLSSSNGVSSTSSIVYTIVIDGVNVYLGGSFTKYRNSTINRIARTSLSGVLDTSFNPAGASAGFASTVNTIHIDATDLYVGGAFTTYRGVAVARLAKLSKASGTLDTSFSGTGASSTVNAIVGDASHIYVGGVLTTWKSTTVNYLAKISKSSGTLDTTFNPSSGGNGANSTVNALALSGSNLIFGGAFTSYRGLPAVYMYKTDLNGNPN